MEAVFSGRESAASLAALPDSAVSKPARRKTGRILVAGDDELLARIIKHRLGREGLDIVHVENGEAAIAALDQDEFDLVMLDVKMPIIDGFEMQDKRSAGCPGNISTVPWR